MPRDSLEVTVGELGNIASATLGVQLARVQPTLRPGRPGAVHRPGRRRQPDDDGVGEVVTALWVVVPAYDEAARIGGTLAALAAQNDRGFTLLVVDNGSTDGTADVVRAFAAPFEVHLVDEPEKRGGLRRGHRLPVRHRARGHAARPHRRRLPARSPGWVAAARAGAGRRRGHGVRPDPGPSRRARPGRDGRRSACWWRSRPRSDGCARRTAAATSRPTGCTPATTWPSPPRSTSPSAACPAARPRPTGCSSTGCAGTPPRSRAAARWSWRTRPGGCAAYGVLRTARWYLDRGSAGLTPDPR